MAKRDRVEDRLSQLSALKGVADEAAVRREVAAGLAERVNLVVAKSADVARHRRFADLAPAMVASFERFMGNPEKSDPGRIAKSSLAAALVDLDAAPQDLLLRGLHHQQWEPVWGGSRDTAARLRGQCAIGLVAAGYRDVLYELADLLFDPDPEARLLAARAAGGTGADAAAILLRAKLAAGKDGADVYAECFASLLSLQPNRSAEHVARFLRSGDTALAESAALAIGGSRHPRAFQLLRAAHSTASPLAGPDARRTLLLAMAMTRDPAAIDLLLGLVADGEPETAADAAGALRVARADPAVAARVEPVVAARRDARVTRRWREG